MRNCRRAVNCNTRQGVKILSTLARLPSRRFDSREQGQGRTKTAQPAPRPSGELTCSYSSSRFCR